MNTEKIMSSKINEIVILGGGSAGWMSAATLIKFYPNKKITVIESPNVPIVGVGESTLGSIRNWMHSLDIDEQDFMKHTNASYKMSIKFTDFYDKDYGSFHYPFGRPVLEENSWELNDWQAKKAVYPDTPVEDYCRTYFSAMPLIENNKFNRNDDGRLDAFRSDLHVAYHFDATLFGQWLRENYCKPKGVIHLANTVVDIQTDDDGISKLVLDNSEEITADLFVDCTGWQTLLLSGALKEPFMNYNHILPNNKAWAVQLPYKDKEKEIEPYTHCTAIGHGWVWNIPLWSRLGTGYVYSDKYITDEAALEEYKKHLTSSKMTIPRTREEVDSLKFKNISMRIGIHERTFVKNVVAIGLSAGFIEPLESTGLFTVHEFLNMLITVLDKGAITQWDRDIYNKSTLEMFNNLAEFVAMHYAMSIRNDTNYWRAISKKTFSPEMVRQDPTIRKGFAMLANKKMFNEPYDSQGGMHCVGTGMNHFTFSRLSLNYFKTVLQYNIKNHVDDFVHRRKKLQDKWQMVANESPTLHQYLKDNIYYGTN